MDNNRLIIKLKMPPRVTDLRFECPICKKSFTTGKGLGGHKRVHVNQPGHEPPSSDTHSCPVCQQVWPTAKSLHGHMRKHRDRNWRGMIPPTLTPSSPLPPATSALYKPKKRQYGKAPVGMIPENDPISVARDLMALSTGHKRKLEMIGAGCQGFQRKKASGGGVEEAAAAEEVASTCNNGGNDNPNQTAGLGFRFDLNKLPPPEEMEVFNQ